MCAIGPVRLQCIVVEYSQAVMMLAAVYIKWVGLPG